MSDLDRLADLYGIEPHYIDVWGNRHDISGKTKAGILNALSVRIGSAEEISEELQKATERLWGRPLPPAIVATAGEPITIRLSLPASAKDTTVGWTLRTEQGSEADGTVTPKELELEDHTELHGERYERRILTLPSMAETGYHQLELGGRHPCSSRLIVCPSRCYTVPDAVGEERVWGVALQLYGVRSETNWGIGDFSDLAQVGERAAAHGASVVGVNPLHALFPAEPRHFSPYSPSTREFLNPLYIDVDRLAEAEGFPETRRMIADAAFERRKADARAAPLVDYVSVAGMKMAVLESVYAGFRERELGRSGASERARAFRAFQQSKGPRLRHHALFEALHEHFYRGANGIWSWREWPDAYRDRESAEVQAFEQENLARIEFYEFLQWQAESQLREAQQRCLNSGMPFGLYCDLAVAVHPDGESAWSYPQALVSQASVGAPPDELGPEGQNWGLAPLSPVGLLETGYAPLIAALRANMRNAGALRIDHVMGLQRLFWIPRGMSGADGAYVRYPLQDLLRIIALESQRNRCIVIGEDLGTVPEGFREAMHAAGVLSYKVLFFEREEGGSFRPPEAYPADALVTASTHDLPTVAGFRACRDVDWREQLGHFSSQQAADEARSDRAQALQKLDAALAEFVHTEAGPTAGAQLFLARSPARVLMVQAEDLLGEMEQPNLPGTNDEHPNWRRKLSVSVGEMFGRGEIRSLLTEIARARPRSSRRD